MAGRSYHVLVERGEDGVLVGSVVEQPGCHTQARTLDELMARAREAVRAYLGGEEPPSSEVQFVGVETVEV